MPGATIWGRVNQWIRATPHRVRREVGRHARFPAIVFSGARGVWLLAFLLLSIPLFVRSDPAQAQERRVALVVGVGGYRNVPTLPNPPSDASDVAAALGRLGFETETLIDPDRLALEAGTRRLGERARGADAAVFFFAGHALEAGGRNWLVPAPADIKTDRDLRYETLDLEGVLEQLDGTARLSILILDACRDNPFRRRLQTATRGAAGSGLGQVQAAAGTLVAFATAPGNVADDGHGRNSPFSAALLRHIETPGLEVRQLMAEVRREVREATHNRQVPWENSALEGNFYFRAAPAPVAPQAAAPPVELAFWESVRASHDPADFRAYLARFPNGSFADLARNRLAGGSDKRGATQAIVVAPAAGATADPSTPEGKEALLLRLLGTVQPVSAGLLASAVQSLHQHATASGNRAMAVAPGRQTTMRTVQMASPAQAEELVLERCQMRNGEPCVLFALNDTIRVPHAGSDWPRRDMERLRYAGAYKAERVPALTPARRQEADIAGYGAAREPKALAIHPLGRAFIVAHASGPFAAEQEALRQCNADPVRANASGPCFLYATGNRVVLPGRHTEPLSPDPTAVKPAAGPGAPAASVSAVPGGVPPGPVAEAPPVRPPSETRVDESPSPGARAKSASAEPLVRPPSAESPATTTAPVIAATIPPPPSSAPSGGRALPGADSRESFVPDTRTALLSRMIDAVPRVPHRTADALLAAYLSEPTHRAFAVAPDRGQTWRASGLPSAEEAEALVLERCQVRYRVACVLFAVDDGVREPLAGEGWRPRDMGRVSGAAGEFDVERIPTLTEARRRVPEVAGYRQAREPKAMAIHPWGRAFIASGAATQEEADARALAICDADPGRAGRDGPCVLYASGNRVVLGEGRAGR